MQRFACYYLIASPSVYFTARRCGILLLKIMMWTPQFAYFNPTERRKVMPASQEYLWKKIPYSTLEKLQGRMFRWSYGVNFNCGLSCTISWIYYDLLQIIVSRIHKSFPIFKTKIHPFQTLVSELTYLKFYEQMIDWVMCTAISLIKVILSFGSDIMCRKFKISFSGTH